MNDVPTETSPTKMYTCTPIIGSCIIIEDKVHIYTYIIELSMYQVSEYGGDDHHSQRRRGNNQTNGGCRGSLLCGLFGKWFSYIHRVIAIATFRNINKISPGSLRLVA